MKKRVKEKIPPTYPNFFEHVIPKTYRPKDQLSYSGGTNRPGELCYKSEMILLRWLTFPLGSMAVTLRVLTLEFVLLWLFLH